MKRALLFLLVAAWLRAEPMTPARIAQLRMQIRADLFVPEPLPALDAQTHRKFSPAPGVAAEGVTYTTELGMKVPAILYLPDPLPKGAKVPGFVVINGHGGDKYSWYAYYTGIEFARGGLAVLTYDPAGEGERNTLRKSSTREHDELKGDATMARRLGGLMMTDVLQAVSYLAARPEVDPARIGAGGYSMGSFVLALAGAVEPRLKVCVLVGGGNLRGAGDYWDTSSKTMCQALPWQSLEFLGDRGATIYALHAARGATYIWNGRLDQTIVPQKNFEPFFDSLQTRAAKLRGSAAGIFEYGFQNGTGHRPGFLERPVVLWLQQHLGFPNWTEAAIRAMPTTLIGDWVRKNGIAADATYMDEIREGGTQAIGTDVPGFQHEDLSVFAPEEWTRRRDQFTFAAWTAAAQAAAADAK
jgi:dienelactone hydrolase